MGKTILIASIIAGIAIMLLFSSQQAYAPSQAPRAAFSFHGDAPGLDMDGGGSWATTGSGKIAGGGTFLSTTTVGSWKAIDLNPTVTCCTPSMSVGGSAVVFTASFNGADKDPITDKKVVGPRW